MLSSLSVPPVRLQGEIMHSEQVLSINNKSVLKKIVIY